MLFRVVIIVLFSLSFSRSLSSYLYLGPLDSYMAFIICAHGRFGGKNTVFFTLSCFVPFSKSVRSRLYWLLDIFRALPSKFQPSNQKFCSSIFSFRINVNKCMHMHTRLPAKYYRIPKPNVLYIKMLNNVAMCG